MGGARRWDGAETNPIFTPRMCWPATLPFRKRSHLAVAASPCGPADDPFAGGDQLHGVHFDLVMPRHQDQRAVLAEPWNKNEKKGS